MMRSTSSILSVLLLLLIIGIDFDLILTTTEAFIASSSLHHHLLSPSPSSPPRSLFLAASENNSPNDDEYNYESSFVAAVAVNNVTMKDSNNNSQNKDDKDDEKMHSSRTELKRQLLTVAASYDRGFSSTPTVRQSVEDIIQQLAILNPNKDKASLGMNGISDDNDDTNGDVPLKGIWRLIWTTAYDVVSLGASPIVAPSAIYQDIRYPPAIINIIDFIPRILLGPTSLLRAKVTTRASIRDANRVGLTFEGVILQPMELLGQKVDTLFPPILSVDFTLPQTIIRQLINLVPGLITNDDSSSKEKGNINNDESPGYFDVEYVDEELLIIRQQVPGGVFALVKVDSCDP